MKIYVGAVSSAREDKTLLPDMEREISENFERICRTARLSSGKLVSDVIGVKWNIQITHRVIKESDLAIYRGIFQTGGVQEIEIEREDDTYDKYVVMLGTNLGFGYWKREYRPYLGWLYRDVDISFLEQ